MGYGILQLNGSASIHAHKTIKPNKRQHNGLLTPPSICLLLLSNNRRRRRVSDVIRLLLSSGQHRCRRRHHLLWPLQLLPKAPMRLPVVHVNGIVVVVIIIDTVLIIHKTRVNRVIGAVFLVGRQLFPPFVLVYQESAIDR